MLKIENIYALYKLGERLGELSAKSNANWTFGQIAVPCLHAKNALAQLLNDGALPTHRCKEPAKKLLQSICDLTNALELTQNWTEPLSLNFTSPITQNIIDFQYSLLEELKELPLFFVDAEGNLSTEKLLKGAHNGYPSHVKHVLTQLCKDEIDEAGLCLVFERATASGFHILRSVELVTKQYLSRSQDLPCLH